jgi:hypothetical protein
MAEGLPVKQQEQLTFYLIRLLEENRHDELERFRHLSGKEAVALMRPGREM